MTIRDLVAAYLRYSASENIHCTESRYCRGRIFADFVAMYGHLDPGALMGFHLEDWVASHSGWQSVTSRRTSANYVKACFAWAAKGGRIAKNPFANVRYGEAERRPELPDEALEQIARCGSKAFERAVRFLRLTGCRLTELCQATWGDVDLDAGLWTIPKHKSRKFTKRVKVVALVAEAVALLRSMAGADAAGSVAPAMPASPAIGAGVSRFLFLNTRGSPWSRYSLGETLRRVKKKHGITTKATLHGIRHRCAAAMIDGGAPIKMVAEQLGHSSVAVTERYYFEPSAQTLVAMRQAMSLGLPK